MGISIKALRVYESAGLVTPDRREGGWRLYGPAQIERLNRILLLKGLGLSLKEVGALLDAPDASLESVLALQERHLAAQLATVRQRFDIVARARRRLATAGSLSLDELMELAGTGSPLRPLDANTVVTIMHGLAAGRDLTGDFGVITSALVAAKVDPVEFELSLRDLLVDASIAACTSDAGSPEAEALADRWSTLMDPLGDRGAGALGSALKELAGEVWAQPALNPALQYLREAIVRFGSTWKPADTRQGESV